MARREEHEVSDEMFDAQEPEVVETEEPTAALDTPSEAHVDDDDPWARLRAELGDEIDPDLVVKNVKQYTQTRQELAEQRRRLEPLAEIQAAFDSDPEFAEYVMGYGRKKESEMSAEEIAQRALGEAQALRSSIQTERALAELHRTVEAEGHPDFDDVALLEFAASNRIADLEAAYLKMMKSDLLSGVKKRVEADERHKKAAKVETRVRGGNPAVPMTPEDIAKLSDDEFEKRYPSILDAFRKR